MTAETQSPTRPRRRWLQYSLRTMLLVMVPVACVAAWLSSEVERGRRQLRAIAWLEDKGAVIVYDEQARQRDWRPRLLGEWYPDVVTGVSFSGYPPGTAGISTFPGQEIGDGAPLAALDRLEELDLRGTTLEDLAPLGGLHHLRKVWLTEMLVRDLSPLAQAEDLCWLDIGGTQVSDLTPLAGLVNLEFLAARRTEVRDLGPLAELRQLEYLGCDETEVADLAPLAGLHALRRLVLCETQVEDLSPLAGLRQLEILNLCGTPVSDVTPLAKLDRLQWLILCDTQVSDVSPLAHSERLEVLWLKGAPVVDFSPLAGLEQLRWENQLGTRFTDPEDERTSAVEERFPRGTPLTEIERELGAAGPGFNRKHLILLYPAYNLALVISNERIEMYDLSVQLELSPVGHP